MELKQDGMMENGETSSDIRFCEWLKRENELNQINNMLDIKTDPIVDEVINKFHNRSQVGIKKYGTTLHENNLSIYQWIDHAIEEQMDNILYLTKLKSELKKNGNVPT